MQYYLIVGTLIYLAICVVCTSVVLLIFRNMPSKPESLLDAINKVWPVKHKRCTCRQSEHRKHR